MSRNIVDDNRSKAVIYCRVAANNDLNTEANEIVVANQQAICREYADNKGYQIASIFIDFASGLTLERDGMKNLIDVIKRHEVSAVIVKDFDRIARSMTEMERLNGLCQKHDVNILSALHDTSYDDYFSSLFT